VIASKACVDEPDVALLPRLGIQVGGPGDYLPAEWLAADSHMEHSFWVHNKVGVVILLSTWACYNCSALDKIRSVLYVHIMH
jgi:hypothetical protein